MRNTNTVDEPIKIAEDTGHRSGSLVYKHPSYGMINFSRSTCGGGVPLFGAKHPSTSIMSLTISKAQNNQDLGRNWYYGYEEVVQVQMTPVQYAELISNPNTEGVPCTINYTAQDGYIKYKPHATEIEYLDVKIKSELGELSGKLNDKKERAKELLTQKGGLKKADKEELLRLIINMDSSIQSTIPWYKEQMEKSVDKMVMEANSDIESLVSNVQTKLGKKLLDNPEALDVLLKDESLLLESK